MTSLRACTGDCVDRLQPGELSDSRDLRGRHYRALLIKIPAFGDQNPGCFQGRREKGRGSCHRVHFRRSFSLDLASRVWFCAYNSKGARQWCDFTSPCQAPPGFYSASSPNPLKFAYLRTILSLLTHSHSLSPTSSFDDLCLEESPHVMREKSGSNQRGF